MEDPCRLSVPAEQSELSAFQIDNFLQVLSTKTRGLLYIGLKRWLSRINKYLLAHMHRMHNQRGNLGKSRDRNEVGQNTFLQEKEAMADAVTGLSHLLPLHCEHLPPTSSGSEPEPPFHAGHRLNYTGCTEQPHVSI